MFKVVLSCGCIFETHYKYTVGFWMWCFFHDERVTVDACTPIPEKE